MTKIEFFSMTNQCTNEIDVCVGEKNCQLMEGISFQIQQQL